MYLLQPGHMPLVCFRSSASGILDENGFRCTHTYRIIAGPLCSRKVITGHIHILHVAVLCKDGIFTVRPNGIALYIEGNAPSQTLHISDADDRKSGMVFLVLIADQNRIIQDGSHGILDLYTGNQRKRALILRITGDLNRILNDGNIRPSALHARQEDRGDRPPGITVEGVLPNLRLVTVRMIDSLHGASCRNAASCGQVETIPNKLHAPAVAAQDAADRDDTSLRCMRILQGDRIVFDPDRV